MTSPWSSGALPADIALSIASLLEAPGVCSLGSCSKFWSDLCVSDSLWRDLTRKRWPHLVGDLDRRLASPPFLGWKSFYISKHKNLACCVATVVEFVEQCTRDGSLEVGYHLKAVNDLRSIELGFKDVQIFLLARKHSVLLNLIGLHYCLFSLGTSPADMVGALSACQVVDREVCVGWFKLGRWFYGFRLPDEHRYRKVSLGELATTNGRDVLGVLNRGAVHEVIRVQIMCVKPVSGVPDMRM